MADSKSDEDRTVAEDFRRQLQERHPAYQGDRGEEDVVDWLQEHTRFLEHVNATNWGDDADPKLVEEVREQLSRTILVNARDEPISRTIVEAHCRRIESAIPEVGVPIQGYVAYGVSPTFELEAARHPIPLMDASVITISDGLIQFCSHLSKVMALSLPHEPKEELISISHNPDLVFAHIKKSRELKLSWLWLFAAYGSGSGPLKIRFRVAPYPQSLSYGLLLEAMEEFAIAHEYAHHIGEHGEGESVQVQGDPNSLSEETEADLFALNLSRCIQFKEEDPNLYAVTGMGATLLIKALDYVRQTHRILSTGTDEHSSSSTHPDAINRVLAFDELDDFLESPEREGYRKMRKAICEVIDAIWSKLRPLYVSLHESGLRPDGDPPSWLPQ